MTTISIAGQDYPVKFGYTALTKMLKLAKKTKFTEIGEVMNDFPAESIPDAIKALIENGLKVEKSELTAPSLNEIRDELDEDVMLWINILNIVGESISVPETAINEGNEQ